MTKGAKSQSKLSTKLNAMLHNVSIIIWGFTNVSPFYFCGAISAIVTEHSVPNVWIAYFNHFMESSIDQLCCGCGICAHNFIILLNWIRGGEHDAHFYIVIVPSCNDRFLFLLFRCVDSIFSCFSTAIFVCNLRKAPGMGFPMLDAVIALTYRSTTVCSFVHIVSHCDLGQCFSQLLAARWTIRILFTFDL